MLFDIPGAPDRIMMRSVVAHEVSDVSERTTITLDDEVAGLIAHEVRRTGRRRRPSSTTPCAEVSIQATAASRSRSPWKRGRWGSDQPPLDHPRRDDERRAGQGWRDDRWHLATLTIQHGGILHTADRGFARYPDLRFVNPLEQTRGRGPAVRGD